MKAHLMHRGHDVDPEQDLPEHATELTQDLGLDTLLDAMAGGDPYLRDVAHHTLLTSSTDPDETTYRQDVLRDCLEHPEVVRAIYDLAVEAVTGEKKLFYGGLTRTPSATLHRAVRVLEFFTGLLRELRRLADRNAGEFRSEGFLTCFRTLTRELDDDFFTAVDDHLQRLQLRDGVLVSAGLGTGLRGTDYVLHAPPVRRNWLRRLLPVNAIQSQTLQIAERDEVGDRTLAGLRDRGVNLVAGALAQSTDHIASFFTMLRRELGFYVGCLNLHDQLADRGRPVCFPTPAPAGTLELTARGLYDVGLALRTRDRVVGNDVAADGASLVMITGANQGGKSTFLRSIGLAQLMMQSGMFVGAEQFRAGAVAGVFTHFGREEDPSMEHGRLDEELRRMSRITENLRAGSLLLCNESLASTNEREGSEIGDGIVRALVESGVKVAFVTHLFDLADRLHRYPPRGTLFLRAERLEDGQRTFRLNEGPPRPTSHGQDLYHQVFGTPAAEWD